jgi:uncharacterized protein (DUF488 family)
MKQERPVILTIGHSTRKIEDFLGLLKTNNVNLLVDVRTLPGSRRNPQFNQEALADQLAKAGILYKHMPVLGGLRKPKKDSVNTAWRNSGFRGYADYMQSNEFETGVQELIQLAKNNVTTIMCAEAVPWKCHRNLLSDALVVHGINVEHILSLKTRTPHVLNKSARVEGVRITYPGPTAVVVKKQKSTVRRSGRSKQQKTLA